MSALRRPAKTAASSRRPHSTAGDSDRFAVLLIAVLLMMAVIAGRLVWIHVWAAPVYAKRAVSQRLRNIELPPRRGTIYDREGEPLAISVEARTLFATPYEVKDKPKAAEMIAASIGGDTATYLKKLNSGSGFVYLARKVDLDQAKELQRQLEKDRVQGIGYSEDYRRVYPSGELACQILGFVGIDDKGLAGLEKYYDEMLSGTPGVILSERDRRGRPIPGGISKEIEPIHGRDIVLSIDKDIQFRAQTELTAAVRKWNAKSGSVVVMDPRNGEILAMASYPGFDPNDYGSSTEDARRNKPVTDAYEPGSTLKCLTASAVIERGLYNPDSMFELPSTIRVGGKTIHESHGRGAVRWSLTDIVTNSSNVGTVKLGLKLGVDGLYESFSAFGLTEKPGTDFPGQARGWLPPPSQWSSSSIGNIPFGQGVSLTPLQLTRAVSAIANKGILTTPHFLLKTPEGEDGQEWPTRRALGADSADAVAGMLTEVVTRGTGTAAAVSGYSVAGKTGTAQKPVPGLGYKAGKYVGSFIGFLPADSPRLTICVTLDEPSDAIYGGTIAAPAFSRIGAFGMSHLRIPPSTDETMTTSGDAGVGPVSDKGVRD